MRITDHTFNRLQVLKAIRRGPVSRIELPALTGLSGGTITQLTSDLIRRGLVIERKGATNRTGGRPRSYLELNAEGTVVVGVSLTGERVLTTAFVNLTGNKIFAKDYTLKAPRSLPGLAIEVAEALEEAIEDFPFARSKIGRIGIALPAVIDSVHGIIHSMTTFRTPPFAFAEVIQDRLKLPVTLENDMNCLARAEHWFGSARALDDFTLVNVDLAIGSAQYANGLPKPTRNGFNQELGHAKNAFGAYARPCMCGGTGCLMMYSSIYGIVQHSGLLKRSAFPDVAHLVMKFNRLLNTAETGDKKAVRLFEDAGFHLGLVIANHVNADDPGNVLILVRDRRFRDLISGSLFSTIRKYSLPVILRCTKIDFDIANTDWRWRGTAALALEKTYLEGS